MPTLAERIHENHQKIKDLGESSRVWNYKLARYALQEYFGAHPQTKDFGDLVELLDLFGLRDDKDIILPEQNFNGFLQIIDSKPHLGISYEKAQKKFITTRTDKFSQTLCAGLNLKLAVETIIDLTSSKALIEYDPLEGYATLMEEAEVLSQQVNAKMATESQLETSLESIETQLRSIASKNNIKVITENNAATVSMIEKRKAMMKDMTNLLQETLVEAVATTQDQSFRDALGKIATHVYGQAHIETKGLWNKTHELKIAKDRDDLRALRKELLSHYEETAVLAAETETDVEKKVSLLAEAQKKLLAAKEVAVQRLQQSSQEENVVVEEVAEAVINIDDVAAYLTVQNGQLARVQRCLDSCPPNATAIMQGLFPPYKRGYWSYGNRCETGFNLTQDLIIVAKKLNTVIANQQASLNAQQKPSILQDHTQLVSNIHRLTSYLIRPNLQQNEATLLKRLIQIDVAGNVNKIRDQEYIQAPKLFTRLGAWINRTFHVGFSDCRQTVDSYKLSKQSLDEVKADVKILESKKDKVLSAVAA